MIIYQSQNHKPIEVEIEEPIICEESPYTDIFEFQNAQRALALLAFDLEKNPESLQPFTQNKDGSLPHQTKFE